MEQCKTNNYLLKLIIKIAFELCRVKQFAKQSEDTELQKILKKPRNSNRQFLKIQLACCIKYSGHKAKLVKKP